MNFYSGLPATLYDSFFPEVDEQELAFYAEHIKNCASPALEIACGTGRMLLPLLEHGLDVEGFDASHEMLAQCKAKAAEKKLAPILYEQRMQDLNLSKQYGCIFSPLGSFQQMSDRADAQHALQKFYDHLLPGGKLIIYLHLPWQDAPTFGDWHAHEQVAVDDTTVIVQEKSVHDPLEQLVFSTYRYEIWQNSIMVSQQEKELTIRWYSRYEFVMMLECVGFSEITVSAGYEDQGPFDVMLFCAIK